MRVQQVIRTCDVTIVQAPKPAASKRKIGHVTVSRESNTGKGHKKHRPSFSVLRKKFKRFARSKRGGIGHVRTCKQTFKLKNTKTKTKFKHVKQAQPELRKVKSRVALRWLNTGQYLSANIKMGLELSESVFDREIFQLDEDGCVFSSDDLKTGLTVYQIDLQPARIENIKTEPPVCLLKHETKGFLCIDSKSQNSYATPTQFELTGRKPLFVVEKYFSPDLPSHHLRVLRQKGWCLFPMFTPETAARLKAQVSTCEDSVYGSDDSKWWKARSLQLTTVEQQVSMHIAVR